METGQGENRERRKGRKKIALEDSFELFFFSARRVMEPSPVEKKKKGGGKGILLTNQFLDHQSGSGV